MSVESSDHGSDPERPWQVLQEFEQLSFSEVLKSLLELKKSSRKELLAYAYQQGHDEILPSTVDRYFNGQRAPRGPAGELFLRLLAEHLALDPEEQRRLQFALEMRREKRIKP